MKWTVFLLLAASGANACAVGYQPTDVPGVCMEINQAEMNPTWVSDEKPPRDKMPSWQREGVTVVDRPSTSDSDAKADLEKVSADKEGKRTAGIP